MESRKEVIKNLFVECLPMTRMLVFALMVLLGSVAFAQTPDEYCATEKAEGENCYMDCCTSLGYAWAGAGCDVPSSEQDYVGMQCMYCTDSYVQCVDYYEQMSSGGYTGYDSGYSSGSTPSSSGGCCAGFALLAAVVGLFSLRK